MFSLSLHYTTLLTVLVDYCMTSVGTKRKKTTTDTSDNISSSSINNSNSSKTAKMWKSNKTKKKSAGSDSHKVAEELFAEIADPDDPQTANMEGMYYVPCAM